jgi:CRP-like cAMP-binding protein
VKKELLINCQHCASNSEDSFCFFKIAINENIEYQKTTISYKRGQTLFVQGHLPHGVFCITKGNVKLSKQGSDKKETIVRIISSGGLLGHESFITHVPYNWTATALEDTEACFIDKRVVKEILQNNPAISNNLIHKLSTDLNIADNKFTSLHQKNVRERLAELIVALRKSHGVLEGDLIKIDLKLSREEKANIVGTASETLIRYMTEFKDAGIIEEKGKYIYIIDEKKLSNWVNSIF